MGFNTFIPVTCFVSFPRSLEHRQSWLSKYFFPLFICELICVYILMFSFCHLHNWEFRDALLLDRPPHKAREYVLLGREKCYWIFSQEDWCSNRICQNSLKTNPLLWSILALSSRSFKSCLRSEIVFISTAILASKQKPDVAVVVQIRIYGIVFGCATARECFATSLLGDLNHWRTNIYKIDRHFPNIPVLQVTFLHCNRHLRLVAACTRSNYLCFLFVKRIKKGSSRYSTQFIWWSFTANWLTPWENISDNLSWRALCLIMSPFSKYLERYNFDMTQWCWVCRIKWGEGN